MKWWYPLCVVVLVATQNHEVVYAMPSADGDSPTSEQDAEELATTPPKAASNTPASLPSAQEDPDREDDLETSDFSEEEIGASGNWIKKKDLLLKSYTLSDEIRSTSAQVQSTRQSFNEKYSAIDDELDNFYKELGLEQGKLQELFLSISKYLENKKKTKLEELQQQKDAHTLKDREFVINIEIVEEEIKKHTKALDQLKLDMKAIEELDKSLTERLKKVDEQIQQATGIEREAKTKIDKLWNILDHTKARTIYYELKGKDLEKLKAIQEYVESDLLQDFEKVSSTIKTQMSKVKKQIAELEKEGFLIQDRAKKIKELKAERAAKAAQEKEQAQSPTAPKKITPKPQPWYTRWYDSLTTSAAQGYKAVKDVFSLAAKNQKQPTHPSAAQQTPLPPQAPAATPSTAPQEKLVEQPNKPLESGMPKA